MKEPLLLRVSVPLEGLVFSTAISESSSSSESLLRRPGAGILRLVFSSIL
ncbi:hypothetical protein ES703_53453 [subsurface metagenome]